MCTVALLSLACNKIQNPKTSIAQSRILCACWNADFWLKMQAGKQVDAIRQYNSPAANKQQKSRDFTSIHQLTTLALEANLLLLYLASLRLVGFLLKRP